MKRLTLAELKEQSAQQVTNNLEAIKGGNAGDCHCKTCMEQAIDQNPANAGNRIIYLFCIIADLFRF